MPDGSFRPCILIPTYDNPITIGQVVRGGAAHLADILVVDDGSADPARRRIQELSDDGLAMVYRHHSNRGKGAAVLTGMAAARERGYTHAFQIDGDAQHDLDRIPAFLEAAKQQPTAMIVGYPVFDATAPGIRRSGRKVARFWVDLEAGAGMITDPMIGFRIYPLASALRCGVRGTGMEFDIEIAVRMAWAGVPIVNLPVAVRYLKPDEGGVSHFRMWRDNARISWLHTRLVTQRLWRLLRRAR